MTFLLYKFLFIEKSSIKRFFYNLAKTQFNFSILFNRIEHTGIIEQITLIDYKISALNRNSADNLQTSSILVPQASWYAPPAKSFLKVTRKSEPCRVQAQRVLGKKFPAVIFPPKKRAGSAFPSWGKAWDLAGEAER